MKITFEGRDWEFDEDDIDVRQATVLYMTYKMTLSEWIEGLARVDQRSLHFTYWLMLQQNGVVKPIADCNPKLIGFGIAYVEARAAAAAAEAQPEVPVVPTIPSPPGVPPSPGPAIPTATTPLLPVPVPPPTVS